MPNLLLSLFGKASTLAHAAAMARDTETIILVCLMRFTETGQRAKRESSGLLLVTCSISILRFWYLYSQEKKHKRRKRKRGLVTIDRAISKENY